MTYTLLIICFSLCTSYCYCQKLVCTGQVLNDHNYNFDYLRVTYKTSDMKQINFSDPQNFDPSQKTVIITHGFALNELSYEWAFEMGKRWLQREQTNVIIVGWTISIFSGLYKKASFSTEHVAASISAKIMELFEIHGKSLNTNFHIVGHSLGAHIAGQTARSLKSKGISVRRVTGLDPAHPCFENKSASLRLRKSDAEFIDVYHTNSEFGKNEGNLGCYDTLGHVDFYLNGGNIQPQGVFCEHMINSISNMVWISKWLPSFFKAQAGLDDVENFVKKVIEERTICHHASAYNYFTESIDRNSTKRWANPTSFPVVVTDDLRCQNRNCDDSTCIEFGVNAENYKNFSGIDEPGRAFYVDTLNNHINCTSS